MYSNKIRTIYNIINSAERETRLKLKHLGASPQKLNT